MENQKFICHSKAKMQYDYLGNPIGMGDERALYYSKSIGKGRVYRSGYPNPSDLSFKPYEFNNQDKAQEQCNSINAAYNDDFAPMSWQ